MYRLSYIFERACIISLLFYRPEMGLKIIWEQIIISGHDVSISDAVRNCPTVAQLDWKLTSSQVINLCFITSVALVCRVFPLRSRTDEVNKLCLQSILSRTVFNCTATSCYLPTPVLISTLSQLHLTVLTNLYPPACFLTDDHFDEN